MKYTFLAVALTIAAPAFAGTPNVWVGNNSWDDLAKIEIAPAGSNAFVTVPAPDGGWYGGQQVETKLPESADCLYTLRATKTDGSVHLRDTPNLCDQTYFSFEDQ